MLHGLVRPTLQHASVATALGLVVALFPLPGRADPRATLVSDGFVLGVRDGPGVGLTAAWDLDVYLLRNRVVSVGPGVAVTVLGTTPSSGGMAQNFYLAADVLRFKIGLNEPGHAWRPWILLGGGFSYTELPAQYSRGVSVVPAINHTGAATSGDVYYPSLSEFAPMLTVGGGGDYFVSGPIALTAMLQARLHLWGDDRVPDVSVEFLMGIRFGI